MASARWKKCSYSIDFSFKISKIFSHPFNLLNYENYYSAQNALFGANYFIFPIHSINCIRSVGQAKLANNCWNATHDLPRSEQKCQEARDGVVPRWWIHERQRQLYDLRWRESGSSARRRDGDGQPPPEFVWLHAPRGHRRRAVCQRFQLRHRRLRRSARMGSRQYCKLWR